MTLSVSTVALAVLLIASMLTVGTGLGRDSFRELTTRPGPLAAGLLLNLVALPAVAVLAVHLTGLSGPAALGIVLAAAAPGGGTGALLAHHARGDLALSVSLQGALAVAGLVSVPTWTFLAGTPISLGSSAWVVAGLLTVQVVPLLVGISLRARSIDLAQRVQAVSRRIADLLLIGVIVWYLATAAPKLADLPITAPLIMLTVVLAGLATYWTPSLGAAPQRRGIVMTTTARNLTLAMFIAGIQPQGETVVIALLAYGTFMYLLAVGALPLMRRSEIFAAVEQPRTR
jgi:BASS family bile acid:Na+ symporter